MNYYFTILNMFACPKVLQSCIGLVFFFILVIPMPETFAGKEQIKRDSQNINFKHGQVVLISCGRQTV